MSQWKYSPRFTHAGDDGSGSYSEPNSTFDTPDEAQEFAEQYVADDRAKARERARDKDWFDSYYINDNQRIDFVIEAFKE